jgi:hypothetical protein
MYTGQHHLSVSNDVKRLRDAFFGDRIDLAIISAGYGMLGEDDVIVPYDATFNGLGKLEAIRRARELKIRGILRSRLQGYQCGIMLLGRAYLQAIEGPLAVAPLEIYFSADKLTTSAGLLAISAGVREARFFGASPRMVAASLFHRFVDHVIERGWNWTLDVIRASDSWLNLRYDGMHSATQ